MGNGGQTRQRTSKLLFKVGWVGFLKPVTHGAVFGAFRLLNQAGRAECVLSIDFWDLSNFTKMGKKFLLKIQRNLHQGSFVFHGADHSGRSSFLRRSHEARVCEPRLEVEPQHHEAHQDDPDRGGGGDDGTDVDQPGVVHAHHAAEVEAWRRPEGKDGP